jgi:hypothetical protein
MGQNWHYKRGVHDAQALQTYGPLVPGTGTEDPGYLLRLMEARERVKSRLAAGLIEDQEAAMQEIDYLNGYLSVWDENSPSH